MAEIQRLKEALGLVAKPDPIAVSIKEAGRLIGMCRSSIEKLIREGKLEAVKIGTTPQAPRRVIYASLKKLIERKEEAA